jgi:hypothetical protein
MKKCKSNTILFFLLFLVILILSLTYIFRLNFKENIENDNIANGKYIIKTIDDMTLVDNSTDKVFYKNKNNKYTSVLLVLEKDLKKIQPSMYHWTIEKNADNTYKLQNVMTKKYLQMITNVNNAVIQNDRSTYNIASIGTDENIIWNISPGDKNSYDLISAYKPKQLYKLAFNTANNSTFPESNNEVITNARELWNNSSFMYNGPEIVAPGSNELKFKFIKV